MKLFPYAACFAALALAACSPAADAPTVSPPPVDAEPAEMAAAQTAEPTVVQLIADNPDLSTLTAAIQAAGLTETLSSEGPFTIFAPANDAFAALPAGALDALLLPESRDELTNILGYHVLLGAVAAADVPDAAEDVATSSVAGFDLSVRREADGRVMVNQYQVIEADIEGTNGIVHIIDGVLIPRLDD